MAAFLAKLPILTSEHRDKVIAWGSPRYKDFRVYEEVPAEEEGELANYCLAGGIFRPREAPLSLKHMVKMTTSGARSEEPPVTSSAWLAPSWALNCWVRDGALASRG